ATIALSNKHDDHVVQNIVGEQLIAQGFYEIMNNSLTHEGHIHSSKLNKDQHVFLLNPLSNDLSVLRQSMVDGGLKSLAYNLNRKQENLRFFEVGKTYQKKKDSYVEKKHFSQINTGNQTRERWNTIERKNDF